MGAPALPDLPAEQLRFVRLRNCREPAPAPDLEPEAECFDTRTGEVIAAPGESEHEQ